MDKAKAVQIFLEQLEKQTRLPLITDEDMVALFGEEVAGAVAELDRQNSRQNLCDDCKGNCCLAVKCELYAPQFGRCPIHGLRPPICRLHYCHKFFPDDDTYLRELSDIFFDCLITADHYGSKMMKYFDAPPLSRGCAALIEATAPWVSAVKEGTLDPEKAIRSISEEAGKFRLNQQ